MPGPWIISKVSSKPVLCVTHYFSRFCKRAEQYFPRFCINSSFNYIFGFLTVIHTFYCFQGPSILTWGTLSHWSHMFQRFHLFLASLVMTWKNIRLEWFGRGNINDIETLPYHANFLQKKVIDCGSAMRWQFPHRWALLTGRKEMKWRKGLRDNIRNSSWYYTN